MRDPQAHAPLDGLLEPEPRRRPVTPAWLTLHEFSYAPGDRASAIVRLLGRLDVAREVAGPALLVTCEGVETRYHGWPRVLIERRRFIRRRDPDSSLLWRATFEVPLHVVEHPEALVSLTAAQRVALALPVPRRSAGPGIAPPGGPRMVARARRHAVAVAAGLVAAAAVSAGGVAGAMTTASLPNVTVSTAVSTAPSSADTTSTGTNTTLPTTATVPIITDTVSATTDAAPTTTLTTAPPPPATTVTTPTTTATTSTTSTTGTTAPPPAVTTPTPPVRTTSVTATPGSRHRRSGASSPRRRRVSSDRRPHRLAHGQAGPAAKTDTPAPSAGAQPVFSLAGDPVSIDPFTAAQVAHFQSLGASFDQPPPFLLPIYRAAGRRYHVPWQILAAINAIETDYGRNLSVSTAGAIGWMQFEPGTWLQYGVSADGSGSPNPYDPRDAIFSAAHYLAANGAPTHIRQALFAYNHALWYVDAVLWRAQLIGDRSLRRLNRTSGYALPLDARYMRTLGRTDDGVDIETAPDGAAVSSITPGVVTAVASDPSGFGPNYPVILVTAGPLAGQYIYYGHVEASLVRAGEHILAGQPIAVMGHTGDASGLGHGHIEIGFSDASGDPLNHHGGVAAWTPAGDAMRHVLEAVAARFRIRSR